MSTAGRCSISATKKTPAPDVDMNVAMTSAGKYVEVQATAEGKVFAKEQLTEPLNLAALGIEELIKAQRKVISL